MVAAIVSLFSGSCTSSPPTTATLPITPQPTALKLPTFAAGPPAEALPHLILAERQASIAKDLDLLAQLWADDSRIVDGRGTTDTADDYQWAGRAAVLDRYRVAVFANPPPPLAKVDDLILHVTGASATGRRGQDRWRFVQRDGRWWLAELRYSQP
ncbi:hypothetical protein BH10CHL1_BH10CHL1_20610 [soil metagenome]